MLRKRLKRAVGSTWLKLFRWEIVGEPPRPPVVMIAAPHTSNWDLPFMLAIAWVSDCEISWMGKDSLFRPPFGWLMRGLGGIAIDRSAAHGVVAQMAEAFSTRSDLILGVPPEGTRGRSQYWKSGFYEIAKAAGVPILPGFLDFANREGGFGPPQMPSGDVHKDMDAFRSFYASKTGKFPDDFTPPRLRAEDAANS